VTRFYWLDTKQEAATDAAEKGYDAGKFIFCADKAALDAVKIADYDAIYLRTGIGELERAFAHIQRKGAPSW
jgi:hypothetical protein